MKSFAETKPRNLWTIIKSFSQEQFVDGCSLCREAAAPTHRTVGASSMLHLGGLASVLVGKPEKLLEGLPC